MKQTFAVVWVAFVVLIASYVNATVYTFEWTGSVESIEDGYGEPATMEGVSVGDSFVATVTYDTADFADGIPETSDGLDYAAPAGLQMTYQFASGGVFTKDITAVRARKYVSNGWGYCQWNWKGGDFGGLLFEANDWSHSAFDLPLPDSFDEMHTLFLNELLLFEPSGGNYLGFWTGNLEIERDVSFMDQTFSVTAAPIAAILLFFDDAVEAGELEGSGPGRSAPNRLNALRNMIDTASELIAGGLYEEACQQLYDAYFRCDGLGVPGNPPDFVSGPASEELAAMILALIAELGCP